MTPETKLPNSYVLGYLLSLALTLGAYFLVQNQLLQGSVLIFSIMVFALIQLWVQLIFFLHLDREKGPRWHLAAFVSTFGVVLIIVVGSLWIMSNLNYNHMSPAETEKYLIHQEGLEK